MKIKQLNAISRAEQARRVNPSGVYRTTGTGAPQAANPAPPADQVYISSQAETVAKLVARVRELPDIRRERVESLRAIATSGAYHPTAADTADAIMGAEKPSKPESFAALASLYVCVEGTGRAHVRIRSFIEPPN